MNGLAVALIEEIKTSRQQTLTSVNQLAEQLHQAQKLLESRQNQEAAELLRQALQQCETITLAL
jgi:prephenate dehydrogenase